MTVEAQGYEKYVQNIDLRKGVLSTIVQLVPGPILLPTPTPIIVPTKDNSSIQNTGNEVNLFVSDYTKTTACFVPGNKILVTAKGSMILGQNIGSSNADGKDNFEVLGLSIPIDKKYYIYPAYPLGALLCRLDTQSDWMACGTSKSWEIDLTGCVEFQVNDKLTSDNSGGYNVSIEVLK